MNKVFAIIAVAFAMSACASSPAPINTVAANDAKACRWVPSYVRNVRDDSMCNLREGKDVKGAEWIDTRPPVSTPAKHPTFAQK